MLKSEFREVVLGWDKGGEVGIIGKDRRFPVAVLERQYEYRDIPGLNTGDFGEKSGYSTVRPKRSENPEIRVEDSYT